MKHLCVALPALALLSACGGPVDGELTAGNWKSTMMMTKFEVPGAPAEVAKQAQAMLNKPQTTEACMTPEMAKAGVREFSGSMQQGECTMEDFKQGGGTMSGTMVCTGDTGFGAPKMTMDGTYTPEKVSMKLSGEVSDSKIPGGKATIALSITSERDGDCKG